MFTFKSSVINFFITNYAFFPIFNVDTNNEKDQVNAKATLLNENELEDVMSDDGDLACSQALDNIEESQLLVEEPTLTIPKIDAQLFKRPGNLLTLNPIKLKLNNFSYVASTKQSTVINPVPSASTSNSNENKPIEAKNSNQTAGKPIIKRNRIFCTPSDDESSQEDGSQKKKPAKKLSFSLNLNPSKILSQRPVLQQQNANDSKDSDKSENDSAYDSMRSSSGSSHSGFGSAAKTGKTPPIFAPGGTPLIDYSEQDLSCLEFD